MDGLWGGGRGLKGMLPSPPPLKLLGRGLSPPLFLCTCAISQNIYLFDPYVCEAHFVQVNALTLKAPITTAADHIHIYCFHCLPEKIRLDVSSDSSARQRIYLKYQALFSSKDAGPRSAVGRASD